MFTGIVTAIGKITSKTTTKQFIATPSNWLANSCIGDSIAVDGACLTITDKTTSSFYVDISSETKKRCAPVQVGDSVNLEHSLTIGDKLCGHFVTGHVDGVATLVGNQTHPDGSAVWRIQAPMFLLPFIAEKGSVCLSGVSLTVSKIDSNLPFFEVHLIRHTLLKTTLATFKLGHPINIEVDLIARHLGRLRDFVLPSNSNF